ncbi:MAG: sigma-70 family RNA polymerase sigma factor [Acidobacteria bacterium]|nr:sigma-70 family RNA polymerase sigma factor [Acidobacteriota bacterium]
MVHQRGDEISPDILESCRQGSQEGFRALYEACKDRVYSIALYFFHGDASAAADASQQVFLKLFSTMRSYRGDARFETWLYRIVVNVCLDSARARKAQPRGESEVLERVPAAHSVERQFVDAQRAAAVQHAVSALPEKLRMAILLRYFDELSYEEMAGALDCSMGTVASRLSRGHKLLAERLAAHPWFARKDK